jgi:hypothetical protein
VFKQEHTQVKVSWIVKLISVVAGYQHFVGPCCLHLHGEVTGDEKNGHRCRPGVQVGNTCN